MFSCIYIYIFGNAGFLFMLYWMYCAVHCFLVQKDCLWIVMYKLIVLSLVTHITIGQFCHAHYDWSILSRTLRLVDFATLCDGIASLFFTTLPTVCVHDTEGVCTTCCDSKGVRVRHQKIQASAGTEPEMSVPVRLAGSVNPSFFAAHMTCYGSWNSRLRIGRLVLLAALTYAQTSWRGVITMMI